MKKLLLLVLVALVTLVAGCDREKYAAHRSERSKPKMEVGTDRVAIRRAPYPNLDILPDGRLRVDDIEIPLDEAQRAMLQTSFVKLQILRQNTLTESAATTPANGARERAISIAVPPGQEIFPADLAQRIPEFKEYSEALANPRALR